MSDTPHLWPKEPWFIQHQMPCDIATHPFGGYLVATTAPINGATVTGSEAAARRIVQCVNDCAGLENPAKTLESLRTACKQALDFIAPIVNHFDRQSPMIRPAAAAEYVHLQGVLQAALDDATKQPEKSS